MRNKQPVALTLQDVIDRLASANDLTSISRRDLTSSIRTVSRWMNRLPSEVPAEAATLRSRLRGMNAAALNISEKRWLNVRSDVLKTVREWGRQDGQTKHRGPVSGDWAQLLHTVPLRYDRWKLLQLARFCTSKGIPPTHVAGHHLLAMRETLMQHGHSDGSLVCGNAVRAWNRCKRKVSGWPEVQLDPLPGQHTPWTLKLEQFPPELREDIEKWRAGVERPDPFEEGALARPLRPSTIRHRIFQIREVASALVHTGHDINEITSLSFLVDLPNLKEALRFMLSRFGGSTEALHGLAMGMRAIATHYVGVDTVTLEKMRNVCANLRHEADGLREKNQRRLLQLDDPTNLAKLLYLPEALVRDAEQHHRPYSGALLVQMAFAIELLLERPLRMGNLSDLEIGVSLWKRQGKKEGYYITIPGEKTKNSKAIHHELGPRSCQLLNVYLRKWRGLLLHIPSDFVFPATNGGPKDSGYFSEQIKKTIWKRAGLDINPHLFRSIVGKIHSLVAPGDVATHAQVLGDSLNTTLKAYAQFQQENSVRHYQRSLETVRSTVHVAGQTRRVARPRR